MKEIKNTKELEEIISTIEDFKIKQIEGNTILNYFEGHDYIIKSNREKLFVVDIQNKEDICEESFKDIICRVIEWNEDLIKSFEKEIDRLYVTLDQHEEYAMLMSKFLQLKEDKKVLDNLYNILIYKDEKHIKLYIKRKNGYDLKSFRNLGEGHKEFTKEMKKRDFEYLELGIDNYDITGKYKIVRKMYL